jgi:hypothetical protein
MRVGVFSCLGVGRLPETLRPSPMLLLLQPLLLLGVRNSGRDARLLLSCERIELLAKSRERQRTVAVLASLVSSGRADPGRQVDEANAALGHVLVLPTRATRAEGFDPALREEGGIVFGDVRYGHSSVITLLFGARRPDRPETRA